VTLSEEDKKTVQIMARAVADGLKLARSEDEEEEAKAAAAQAAAGNPNGGNDGGSGNTAKKWSLSGWLLGER
jgi:hypothetical protein